MKAIAFSLANQCYFPRKHRSTVNAANPNHFITQQTQQTQSTKSNQFRSLTSKSSINPLEPFNTPPLVVVGSANADLFVEIDRLPKEGETVSAKNGEILAGGKGANQAVCASKLGYPSYFLGQLGEDANGFLIIDALKEGGVHIDYVRRVSRVPTGHAVVMLQSDGQNSIIIVGGANVNCWPKKFSDEDLVPVKSAGIVLLQREIPDNVNLQVAKAAKKAGVPVILDAGGMDTPLPSELLNSVDFFSPNESELGRITGMPTENFEQIGQAVRKSHEMGVKQVLVKLGAKGSALFEEGKEPIRQPAILAKRVIDTTGAGDTFTAAFAVALVEGMPKQESMRFAAAAASLCVQVKGAIPSMPDRISVLDLLKSV